LLRVITEPDETPEALAVAGVLALLGASDEDRVQELIQDATRFAEELACCKLWRRTYEEVVRAEGNDDRLYLSVRPIVSLTTNPALDPDGTPLEDVDFELWWEQGFLSHRRAWPRGAWRQTYEAGLWLPSMGDNTDGDPDIAVQGRQIRRAIEEIVVNSYQLDGVDRSVAADRMGGRASISTDYFEAGKLFVPEAAAQVLRRLAPIVP
jgi:hypothetical protein